MKAYVTGIYGEFCCLRPQILLTKSLLRGPLIFCLLLSLLLSIRASPDQKPVVFSGVFALVWIGEAVVTMQIKLLGGNMYVLSKPDQYASAEWLLAPSSNQSALLAILCSHLSSLQYSVRSNCLRSRGFPFISFSSLGL